MKAKYFRIGNLLRSKQWGGIGLIEGIEIFDDYFEIKIKGYIHKVKDKQYFDLEPIPLTKEWLLNFGFKNDDISFYHPKYGFTVLNYFGEFVYNIVGTKIKYVHQLQNLYFALTGEELTINH